MRSVGVGHPLAHSYLMKRQRDRTWPDGGPEIVREPPWGLTLPICGFDPAKSIRGGPITRWQSPTFVETLRVPVERTWKAFQRTRHSRRTPMNRFSMLGAALFLGLVHRRRPGRRGWCGIPTSTTARWPSPTSATSGWRMPTARACQRLTVHKARDVYPRFSPDGSSIAFSTDREGNMDVYVIPPAGGEVQRLTVHSADETVLDWTRDSRSVLFASQRGEDCMAKLYVVPIDGGCRGTQGPTWASPAPIRPTAPGWPSTARPRPTGASTIAAPTRAMSLSWTWPPDLQGPHRLPRHGFLADVEPGRLHLLRQRPRRARADQHLADSRERRRRRAGDPIHWPATSASPPSAATARRSSSSAISASASSTSPARRSSRSGSTSSPRPRRRSPSSATSTRPSMTTTSPPTASGSP